MGAIANWSLPQVTTCPGRSKVCQALCYVNRGFFPFHERKYINNYQDSQSPNFVAAMVEHLQDDVPVMRIHTAGDFYSVDYTLKWCEIVEALPSIQFYSYTRSWNTDILPALEVLRAKSNMQLFASVDYSMPDPPAEWRKAYLVSDPRATGPQCMKQTGQRESCEACGFCFRGRSKSFRLKITHSRGGAKCYRVNEGLALSTCLSSISLGQS